MARTRQPYQDIWNTMKANADKASVRPAPLSNVRSAPGNVRYGSLQERFKAEVPVSPKVAASPISSAEQLAYKTKLADAVKAKEQQRFNDLIGEAPKGMFAGPAGMARIHAQGSAAISSSGPVWMGKGDGTSGIRVQAPNAAAVERLRRSGYSLLDQKTQSAGEQALFGAGARDAGPDGIAWKGEDGVTKAFARDQGPEGVSWRDLEGQSGTVKDARTTSVTRTGATGRVLRYTAPVDERDPYSINRLSDLTERRVRQTYRPDAPPSTPAEVMQELAVSQHQAYVEALGRQNVREQQAFETQLDAMDEGMLPLTRRSMSGIREGKQRGPGDKQRSPEAELRDYVSFAERKV